MREEFIPVVLGTDWNAYGVASSIYQEYGLISHVFGRVSQKYTENLNYIKIHLNDDFIEDHVFVKVLNDFAVENKGKKLLLISCSDYYTESISRNKDKLSQQYLINYIEDDLRKKLENKIDFYQICEEYGLPYPATYVVTKDNPRVEKLDFDFPVILKPNDSFKWVKIKFEGYKKAFTIDNLEELNRILDLTYKSGYDDMMIIQDYIPGGLETMYVINAYVSKSGKVVMTHPARTALDDPLPYNIGNYNALISGSYPELSKLVVNFLEKLDYKGFANFDVKFDSRDNTFKFFEINIRQGRSSMYMTYAGNNFMKYMVEDMVYDQNQDYYDHKEESLWYITDKSVLKKYSPDLLKDQINRLIDSGKGHYGFEYASDQNFKRYLLKFTRKISTILYYRKYS